MTLEVRKDQALAQHRDQVIAAIVLQPARTNRVVVGCPRLGGDVPALHDPVVGALRGQFIISPEPAPLDHGAARRDRRLLVLGREAVGPEPFFRAREGLMGLPLRMQQVARLALDEAIGPDLDPLRHFGDRRQVDPDPERTLSWGWVFSMC